MIADDVEMESISHDDSSGPIKIRRAFIRGELQSMWGFKRVGHELVTTQQGAASELEDLCCWKQHFGM